MTDTNDWSTQIIEEFRANDGKVGGNFEGSARWMARIDSALSRLPSLV